MNASKTKTVLDLTLSVIIFCVAITSIGMFDMVYADDTIQVVTSRGNVFVLEQSIDSFGVITSSSNDTNHDDSTDGFGINSRLIKNQYHGDLFYGASSIVTKNVLKPYNAISEDTQFVSVALAGSNITKIPIPEFYQDYSYDNTTGTLTQKTISENNQNRLGYTNIRVLKGDITVSIDGTGIKTDGTGRAIIKLDSVDVPSMLLSGELSEGTTVRLVQSPYDLMNQKYDSKRKSFLISDRNINPGPNTIRIVVGSADDSVKSGTFSYTQEKSMVVYHGKCCKGAYGVHSVATRNVVSNLVVTIHGDTGYHLVTGDYTNPELLPLGHNVRAGAKTLRLNYNIVNDFNHKVFDTLPVKVHESFTGTFEKIVDFPTGVNYLVVDSTVDATTTSRISGVYTADLDLVNIDGLPPNTAYEITRDDALLFTGKTSSAGDISISTQFDQLFYSKSGVLHLYTDAITHVDTSGGLNHRLAVDVTNNQVIPLVPIKDDTVYVIHAFVKIPITSNVQISDVTISGPNGVLPLDYFTGNYSAGGNSILVPVIPKYNTITLDVDDTPITINIADVIGSNLMISDTVSNTVRTQNPDDFTDSIESTVGTVTYMIATTDGSAKANIQATVSGESTITNTKKYVGTKPPPPPPPPRPRDPLTAWIEIYVNGQPQTIHGQEKHQIFFSNLPVTNHDSGLIHRGAYHTANFAYPAVTVSDTVSTPVSEADFVEFYFYGTIYAEGSVPPTPAGYQTYQKISSASAIVTIKHASINTGM